MNLLYKNEKPLFITLLVISLLFWIAITIGTLGAALLYVASFMLFYLVAQSAFISYLKGTGVEITAEQFPDLHEKIEACCRKLGMDKVPAAYLMHMDGMFNAMATRFLGKNFIVLFSDIVDALEEHPDALNFYVGHEIGHLQRKHLTWGPLLAPAAVLPLIGTAYSRAREYTCDRHGLAACDNPASAQIGLAALAAGHNRWKSMNQARYVAQTKHTSGFWMSLHELLSDYPWLTKRSAAMQALANGQEAQQPKRHLLAWCFAMFFPRAGMGGAAGGLIMVVAIIGILAAVAIPAYQDYMARANIIRAVSTGRAAATAVENYYYKTRSVPDSLKETGFSLPAGASAYIKNIVVSPKNAVIIVTLNGGAQDGKDIVLAPSLDEKRRIHWSCGSEDIPKNVLPKDCRDL